MRPGVPEVETLEETTTRSVRVTFLLEVRTPYRDKLLARLYGNGNFDLSVLYCTDSEPWRDWNLAPERYPTRTLPGIAGGGRSGGFQAKLNPTVWSALSAADPQVVFVGGYALPTNQLAMLWCRRHRVPYLLLWESHDLDERSLLRRGIAWAPSLAARRGAAGILPASSSAQDRLVRSGVSADKMHILPNAPDVRSIAATVHRGERPPDRPPTFLYSGRLVASKDVPTLLHAFVQVQRKLPDARLVILGSGPLGPQLAELRDRLALRTVTFKGFVQPDDLTSEFEAADVFVLPSRREPFGVVVMEAMAAGMPVIASTRVGAARDLLTESCGIVFPVGDTDRLASAMIDLGTDAERRHAMGLAARSAVMRWDIDYCVATVKRAVRGALQATDRKLTAP